LNLVYFELFVFFFVFITYNMKNFNSNIYLNSKYSKFIIFNKFVFIDLNSFSSAEDFYTYLIDFMKDYTIMHYRALYFLEFHNFYFRADIIFVCPERSENLYIFRIYNMFHSYFNTRYILLKIK
jgi:hypothetical protein